eukprot:TRINITY_DN38714_c0_g1_i1.p1 TRINITY_DN38714_c0_g1~~TRINITY_DN38714_c0_g1_i1.p1  ORF type:complete len:160 (-),score=36.17 TRINITY_DN38714_c0_g1_i1:55-534(-)
MFGTKSQVVPTPWQGKKEVDAGPKWQCDQCGRENFSSAQRCAGCGALPREERSQRMKERESKGLGRGGGYFERDEPAKRGDDDMKKVKGGVDIYGRVQTSATSTKDTGSSSKAAKQQAALERLRGKRTALSPPKACHFREKSSRSRSAERRREARRWGR